MGTERKKTKNSKDDEGEITSGIGEIKRDLEYIQPTPSPEGFEFERAL